MEARVSWAASTVASSTFCPSMPNSCKLFEGTAVLAVLVVVVVVVVVGGGGGGGVAAGAVVSSMGWEKLLLQSNTANDGEEKRCVCFAVFVYWWKRNEQREHFMHSKCLRLLTYLM